MLPWLSCCRPIFSMTHPGSRRERWHFTEGVKPGGEVHTTRKKLRDSGECLVYMCNCIRVVNVIACLYILYKCHIHFPTTKQAYTISASLRTNLHTHTNTHKNWEMHVYKYRFPFSKVTAVVAVCGTGWAAEDILCLIIICRWPPESRLRAVPATIATCCSSWGTPVTRLPHRLNCHLHLPVCPALSLRRLIDMSSHLCSLLVHPLNVYTSSVYTTSLAVYLHIHLLTYYLYI